MCGRFYLKFLPVAEDVLQRIFNLPFPQAVYPPILADDILPIETSRPSKLTARIIPDQAHVLAPDSENL